MHITIDTSESLSDKDKQILAVLTGSETPAPATKAAPAPAKKTAAAKPEPTPEPDPEPEPEPEDEDVLGEDAPTHTKADLKALATKVVAAGEAKKVKEALATVGAGKISEVTDEQVDTVYAALSA